MLDTQTITHRFRLSQYRTLILGMLGIIALAYLFRNMFQVALSTTLVLAAQIFLFVLLFKRPVWAIAALIVSQTTLPTYTYLIGGVQVSATLTWTVLSLLLVLPVAHQRGGIKLGSGAKRIIIPALILICIAIVANIVNTDSITTYKFLRQEFSWLAILFLIPAAVKNEKDLKRLALVALITCAVSALFALKQWYNPDMRDDLDGRMIGLAISPSHLGYTLPLIILPTIAMYFQKGVNSLNRKFLLVLIAIMAVGLYVSFTRVGIYSLIPGVLFMILIMQGKSKKALFLVSLIVGVVFLGYIVMESNRYTEGFTTEDSAAGRLVLWQSGMHIAMDYPILGIGAYKYEEMSTEYASTINPDYMTNMGAGGALGIHNAHNDFITVWVSFGTFALLAYLCVFVGIFRNFAEANRNSRTRFLKGFAIGCFGTMVAYIINSATHNILLPTMLLWVFAGLSIAAVKIAEKREANTAASQIDIDKY